MYAGAADKNKRLPAPETHKRRVLSARTTLSQPAGLNSASGQALQLPPRDMPELMEKRAGDNERPTDAPSN